MGSSLSSLVARFSLPAIRALAVLTVIAALVAIGAGCKGERQATPSLSAQAQAPSSRPLDGALPSELAEGKDDAFGLPIPREMSVRARFSDAVFASGTLSLADVASYVRERVTPEHVETGPAKTVLTGARLRGAWGGSSASPSGPPIDKKADGKILRIEVIAQGSQVSLVVRDETRPPAKEGMTEADRWRALGLTPQGAPLDPTTLE